MPENKSRSATNLALLVFYYVLNCIIPSLLIVWGSVKYDPLPIASTLSGVMRLLLFWLVLPVMNVYLLLNIKTYFPSKNPATLKFFLPYLVNLAIYLKTFGLGQGFFSLWLVQSLPLFLGYLASLIGGFYLLLIARVREEGKLNWEKWLGSFILLLFFLIPFAYMFAMGLKLVSEHYVNISPLLALSEFVFSIGMVISFHFPILTKLYREGEL